MWARGGGIARWSGTFLADITQEQRFQGSSRGRPPTSCTGSRGSLSGTAGAGAREGLEGPWHRASFVSNWRIRQLPVAALEVTEEAQAELEGRAGVKPLHTPGSGPGPGPVIPQTNYLEIK